MAIQSSFYATDGTTRTFPSTKHIASKQNVAVYLQSVLTSTWSVISPTLYDLVGNNIVFGTAPDEMIYSEIEIRVADTQAELGNNPSDIAIVASISEEIITITNDKVNVDTVAGNIGSINTVSGSITSVNSVSGSITSVNSVASEVIPNITAILDAPNQALSADNSASAASTSETNAANSASAASTSETNAANSASAASTSEINAANSASAASTSETNAAISEANAANSASAASISETNAAISEASAEAYAASINPALLTPLTTYNNHIPLSRLTSYHLLSGSLVLANSVITNGFSTTLYTGNDSTRSINTGIDMSTQWGNDASETFGGLVWLKSRSAATNNYFVDTVRGVTKDIYSNATTAETTEATGLTAFGSTGFSLGALAGMNTNTATYVSWNFQTTHKRTGTTNHGKAYTEHYNPFTGFTIIKYEGSGLAEHKIPHSLGRKLGFVTGKNLTDVINWIPSGTESSVVALNSTTAGTANTYWTTSESNITHTTTIAEQNASTKQYIIYGWANSYYDEANTLIGNYEVGVYQGTGASDNKVTTRGKPAWVMRRRLDSTSDWAIEDIMRGSANNLLRANNTTTESTTANMFSIVSDGFVSGSADTHNVSGGQYLYMVVYDNDSGSGKSKYPRATDSSTLNLNAVVPFANGVDANGTKISTLTKNETVSGLTLSQGKNYVYAKNDGTYGVSSYAPNYGNVNPANGGDFYNVLENKWYTSAGVAITESRNYLNAIVYADQNGQVEYVEQLPKTLYVDEIKANEFKGKNACTAWVNFDGTTTPPTIRDSYNVKAVIRTSTGLFDVYFEKPMDNANYSIGGICIAPDSEVVVEGAKYINKASISAIKPGIANHNVNSISTQIFGGKN